MNTFRQWTNRKAEHGVVVSMMVGVGIFEFNENEATNLQDFGFDKKRSNLGCILI